MADKIEKPFCVRISPCTAVSETRASRTFTWEYTYGVYCSFKVRVSKLDYSLNIIDEGAWEVISGNTYTVSGDVTWGSGVFVDEAILYQIEIKFSPQDAVVESEMTIEVYSQLFYLKDTYNQLGDGRYNSNFTLSHWDLTWVLGGEPISGCSPDLVSTVKDRLEQIGRRYYSDPLTDGINYDGVPVNTDGVLNRLQKQLLANDLSLENRINSTRAIVSQAIETTEDSLAYGVILSAMIFPDILNRVAGAALYKPIVANNMALSNASGKFLDALRSEYSIDVTEEVGDPIPIEVWHRPYLVKAGLANFETTLLGDFRQGGYYNVDVTIYPRMYCLLPAGSRWATGSIGKILGVDASFFLNQADTPNGRIKFSTMINEGQVYGNDRAQLANLRSSAMGGDFRAYKFSFGYKHTHQNADRIYFLCRASGYTYNSNGDISPHTIPAISSLSIKVTRVPHE